MSWRSRTPQSSIFRVMCGARGDWVRSAMARTRACCFEWAVPRQAGRPARRARMEVRFGKVELMCPRWLRRSPRLRGSLPDSVALHVVDVRECGSRPGTEPPLHWRLLTTHLVETAE